jgi:hypothetical protein
MSPLQIAENRALEQWMLAREASEWEAARLRMCAEEADRRDEINCSPGPQSDPYWATIPVIVHQGNSK